MPRHAVAKLIASVGDMVIWADTQAYPRIATAMQDPHRRSLGPDSLDQFPLRRFGPYTMSVQGDKWHLACSPKERLDDIRDYETVEVSISGPGGMIDVQRAGFPPEVRKLFPRGGGSRAHHVTQEGVALIEDHLRSLANAPIPSKEPSDGPKAAVHLSDAGLREVLLKLNEAVVHDTGEVNADLVAAVADLVEAARVRGIDFDGFEAVENLQVGGFTL